MKLICNIKNSENVILQLKKSKDVIDELNLTVDQDLDTLLIIAIDKLLIRNTINRLSLKVLIIQGKIRPEAVSSMMLKILKIAFEI